jgi:membrane protein YqaA with SNARE-associated domain
VRLLLGTFAFSVGSALLPILNVEAYLAIVAAQVSESVSFWELAVVAGAGQSVGKIIWYYVGLNSLKLRWMRKKMESPKWAASYERWYQRAHGKPLVAGAVTLVSSVTGFPPLAVIAVLAGTLRMNFPLFLATVFVGRTLRFWLVLAGVGVVFGH